MLDNSDSPVALGNRTPRSGLLLNAETFDRVLPPLQNFEIRWRVNPRRQLHVPEDRAARCGRPHAEGDVAKGDLTWKRKGDDQAVLEVGAHVGVIPARGIHWGTSAIPA